MDGTGWRGQGRGRGGRKGRSHEILTTYNSSRVALGDLENTGLRPQLYSTWQQTWYCSRGGHVRGALGCGVTHRIKGPVSWRERVIFRKNQLESC